MTSHLLRKPKKVICGLLLAVAVLCSSSPVVAQMSNGGVIRVESNEVFVPVLVLDKKRVAELQHMNWRAYWEQVYAGNFASIQRLAVSGIAAKDFRLWEDGQQQDIDSVTAQGQTDSPIIFDNLGGYRELVGPGGGAWSIPLRENGYQYIVEAPGLAGYALAFTPGPSPDGSCHSVKIAVDRPDSLVFARTEYCDARHSAADPLNGTKLGRQLETHLETNRPGKISIAAAAIPLFAHHGTAVRVVVDYASQPELKSCSTKPAAIGILGIVYSGNRNRVLSFSDITSRTYGDDLFDGRFWTPLVAPLTNAPCPFRAPFRYATQVEIPAGTYSLEIGFMDGKKFGRADLEVTVPNLGGGELGISGIVLSRRFRDLRTQPPESPLALSARQLRDTPMRPANSLTLLPENYAPLVSDGVQVTPTANTRFEKNSPFSFYFQIYDPMLLKQSQLKLKAELQIVDAKTGNVVNQIKPIDASFYARPGNPIIPIGRRLDISSLHKGSYTLQAKATDSTGASTDWQSVAFTVE